MNKPGQKQFERVHRQMILYGLTQQQCEVVSNLWMEYFVAVIEQTEQETSQWLMDSGLMDTKRNSA